MLTGKRVKAVVAKVSDNNRIQPRSASRRADPKRARRLTKLEELVSRKPIYYYFSIVCNRKLRKAAVCRAAFLVGNRLKVIGLG